MNADEDEAMGLSMGAVDYVTKPVRPAILSARIKAQLELKQSRDWLANQNGYLEKEIQRRMHENELIKDLSLHALAMLAEKRDNETGNHLLRTRAYVEALMDHLQDHPRFQLALKEPQRTLIAKAAPLHDIGKVGIPDHILLKPARLTPQEFEVMKQHSQIGADAIGEAIERALSDPGENGEHNPAEEKPALAFLEVARQIAQSHHEKWNGKGYPQGLSGDHIPVSARLMALADVYDALTCKRHYKEPFPLDKVEAILREGRGEHFDPDVVDAYFDMRERFMDIAQCFSDASQHKSPDMR
jgi:putative two-component system response regulator